MDILISRLVDVSCSVAKSCEVLPNEAMWPVGLFVIARQLLEKKKGQFGRNLSYFNFICFWAAAMPIVKVELYSGKSKSKSENSH